MLARTRWAVSRRPTARSSPRVWLRELTGNPWVIAYGASAISFPAAGAVSTGRSLTYSERSLRLITLNL